MYPESFDKVDSRLFPTQLEDNPNLLRPDEKSRAGLERSALLSSINLGTELI